MYKNTSRAEQNLIYVYRGLIIKVRSSHIEGVGEELRRGGFITNIEAEQLLL